jgi:predicted homoserine dehydrogenase-like protein
MKNAAKGGLHSPPGLGIVALMLARLNKLDRDIRVLMIGAGAMGRGLYYQLHHTPGIRCAGLADLDLGRAVACAERLGTPYRIVTTAGAAADTIAAGNVAICTDGRLLAQCPVGEVLLETSSAIAPAARFVLDGIESGKHIVLMNAEVDLAFGPRLLERARERGVVYTSCDGDQHGVLARLVDELRLWGFDFVMAGNIKGFLDRYSNPTAIVPEADKRNLDYRMCTAYTDGTKLNIEMALVANGMGASAPCTGMLGPAAREVGEVFDRFDFPALSAAGTPMVDYVLGAEPGGGVFAIGRCTNAYQRDMLHYYKRGRGPFFLFYRPYHLCHIEAVRGIAEAVLDKKPLLQPVHGFRTNVYAYAKKTLPAGTVLDGLGGYCCYGLIENAVPGAPDPGLPICLSEGVTLQRAIAKDERIALRDATWDAGRFDFALYSEALAASARLAGNAPAAGRP